MGEPIIDFDTLTPKQQSALRTLYNAMWNMGLKTKSRKEQHQCIAITSCLLTCFGENVRDEKEI